MKRLLKALALTGLPALLFFGGCKLIVGPDEPAGGGGNITLSLAGDSRAITSGADLPADLLAALRYEILLTGPGGVEIRRTAGGGDSLRLEAALGLWRVEAWAYQEEVLAGTGSLSFTVRTGDNSIRIPMMMSGPCYEVKIDPEVVHGTVKTNFNAAFAGTPITITPVSNEDSIFMDGTLTAKPDSIDLVPGPGTGHTFTMPAGDVELSAKFISFTRYVTQGGKGDGSSWDSASNDIQKMMDKLFVLALDYSRSYTGPFIVKVGAGTYKPQYKPDSDGIPDYTTLPGDRDSAFILRPGVQLRGGYKAAGEDIDEPARKARFNADGTVKGETMYKAVLSGDIDTGGANDVHHVVLGVDIPADSRTVLDGFTITKGYATGSSSLTVNSKPIGRTYGGGIYNAGSSPVLVNVTISGNTAATGGGIYNEDNSSPILTGVTITSNTADYGGGMANHGSSPVLVNVTISGNTAADNGGGISNSANSSPLLINTVVSGNTATGKTMPSSTPGNGGGVYNNDSASTLINVTISDNSAPSGNGGGVYIENASSQTGIRNSIIWGNTASSVSNNIVVVVGTGTIADAASITHSIVEGSGGSGNWIVSNAVDSGWNQDTNPSFVDFTARNYRLDKESLAIDKGNGVLYPDKADDVISGGITISAEAKAVIGAALKTDLAGNPRIQGTAIDMGAYEKW